MPDVSIVISGPEGKRSFIPDPAGTKLGRDPACDVILSHRSISRLHARIHQATDQSWIIEDLGSRNGIVVNGQKVKSQTLTPNQKVLVSGYALVLTKPDNGLGGRSFSIIDRGNEEQILPFLTDAFTIHGLPVLTSFNAFTQDLMTLSSTTDLFARACAYIAESTQSSAAVLRLASQDDGSVGQPEVLAFQPPSGATENDPAIYFSLGAMKAACSTPGPVMARSNPLSDDDLSLTITDGIVSRVVFAVHLGDVDEAKDLLYVEVPEANMSENMFDFIEATSQQINFVQKNILYVELQEKEKALRKANLDLMEKDRIKNEYVSRVTHDIKGHLGVIGNCLDFAAADSGIGTPEKKAEFLNRASRRTTQLLAFVMDLLHLTQLRLSGRAKDELFSLKESIESSLKTVEPQAREKNITLTGVVSPQIDMMIGDQLSITEVIANLLFNAIKYTPENESVALCAEVTDGEVVITIKDTGIGIPPEDVEKVFEEFFRASNAAEFTNEGTGLGLALVKQIVERHQGNVNAANNPDKGAVFSIRLPALTEEP